MERFSLLISRYLVQAVMPYFIFSWLLLSVILFVQQASRFSDILFSVNIPSGLVWQLTVALIPSVVAFTCPMAALVGVIIGLSKMQGDSELVVIRAAGIGNFQITLPIILLGVVLSAFAFFINLKGVPFAAQLVKQVAIQSAIYKLESPIEPGVFNTEINGYTIYVKSGDLQKGEWRNIFIFNEDTKTKEVRLITSTNGRIDSTDEASELVLQNAVVSTFSTDPARPKYVSESVGGLRFAIKTRRGELIERLTNRTQTPEELGLADLSEFSRTVEGKDRVEAQILLFRMLMLSITPLIFVLLGAALVLRFNRGGRGFGIFLALASLVIYYLLALLGEQLARTDKISVLVGSLIPVVASALAIIFLYLSPRLITNDIFGSIKLAILGRLSRREASQRSRQSLYLDLSTGILDFDIVRALLKFFLLTIGFLAAIFIIFTAFELWKFAGTIEGGVWLLTRYLFFLLPFIYIQLAPSALMIAMLATYVIKSRQNEVVTWMSAGQSVYRLLAPCFLLMLVIGGINYGLQETVLPRANQIQDDLRMQIRSRGKSTSATGKLWVANNRRIYSFQLPEGPRTGRNVNDLTVYEFAPDGGRLQAVYKAPQAVWERDRIRFDGTAEKSVLTSTGKPEIEKIENGELAEDSNPLAEFNQKPAHLTAGELREAIRHSDSTAERKAFQIALQKKYATLFLPLVIMLFTAPFALSISRKGKAVTVGYAVGLWLLFMGVTNVFEQFGQNGYLRAELAVWGPVALFSLVGVYLLSRVRT